MAVFSIDALVSIGMVVFTLNRLYTLFTKHQINVKGIVYSRAEQPIYYWFWVVAATVGLCAGLGLFYMAITLLIGRNPFA